MLHLNGSPSTTLSPDEGGHADFGSLLRVLSRRWRPAAAIFLAFLVLVVALTLLVPKSYTTTVKLIAGSTGTGVGAPGSSLDSQLPVLNALLMASGVQSAETYVELFQETPVAEQVIAMLGLRVTPHELLDRVEIKPITNTSIIALSVTWPNADESAQIANAFGSAVVDRERQLVAGQAGTALQYLAAQLPDAQNAMSSAQSKLAAFEASHHIADIDAQTQSTIAQLAALDSKIGQVQADDKEASAELASARAQLGSTPATIVGSTTIAQNPALAQLQSQLSQVDVQLKTALTQYTPEHPAAIALQNQKAQIEREIAKQQATVVSNSNIAPNPVYQQLQQQAAQFSTQIAADDAQTTALRAQEKAVGPKLAQLPGETAALADLQRQSKATQDVYSALQDKYNNAAIARDTALSDVTVTQPANARFASIKPNLLLNLALGIALGLILGVLGAFVLEYFDNTIKDDREVEAELALPALGAIPLVKMRNGSPELAWVRTLTIESFLQLVTSIKYASDAGTATLAVTSPVQGDGKSTIALNVAIAMAELEPRVLLVDADLRRASLHLKLRAKNERGLSDILVGRSNFLDVVQGTRYNGLDVLTSGTPTPNPIKLLESPRMDDLLRLARERYRCVVIDATALSVNVDSAVIARKTDGAIMVLSAGQTDLRAAKRALKRLQQVGVHNLLGYVFNRVVPRREDFDAYELRIGAEDATNDDAMITA